MRKSIAATADTQETPGAPNSPKQQQRSQPQPSKQVARQTQAAPSEEDGARSGEDGREAALDSPTAAPAGLQLPAADAARVETNAKPLAPEVEPDAVKAISRRARRSRWKPEPADVQPPGVGTDGISVPSELASSSIGVGNIEHRSLDHASLLIL